MTTPRPLDRRPFPAPLLTARFPHTRTALMALLLATFLGGPIAQATTPAPPTAVAQALAAAEEHAALPASAGGGWLLIDPQAVRLLDAAGVERARLALRAEHLDVRPAPGAGRGARAVVFDNNLQQPLLLDIDDGQLNIAHRFAPVDFALETMCLYRDAQQLDHLFMIAKDGLAEQWLLSTSAASGSSAQGAPRLLRRLALPPNAEHCRGDDARGQLYITEEGLGVWAYAADGEGVPQRRLLGARLPPAHRLPAPASALPHVVAQAQTDSVARSGDAADDPAIWVHPGDASRSRVFGTNKKQGLLNYDLQGRQVQLLESGRLNNVDLRQNLLLGGAMVDLAVATQRDDNTLVVFEIDAQGQAREAARIGTGLKDIYGMCLHRTPQGGLEAFANDKSGRFEQIRITRRQQGAQVAYTGERVRVFRTRSQPEGCVADDHEGQLFFGEEKRGIWTLPTDANAKTPPRLILATGKLLVADVEGLAIYRGAGKQPGYLIASSQGNNSYVVLDARPPHTVRGAFRIGINAQAGIDGASETDGLEVSPANLGGAYHQGLLVVQDGYKRLPDGAQNFKYVAWRDIAEALGLN